MSDEIKSIGFIIVIVFGVVYGTLGIANQMSLPGQIAKIEQLRKDIKKTAMGNNEDVVGQVTQWNQEIRSMQAYNNTWYAGLIVPDAWDHVELIPLPDET